MIQLFKFLLILLVSTSCAAKPESQNEKIEKLITHFYQDSTTLKSQLENHISGDFNGDKITDLAVLFLPKSKPKAHRNLKIYHPNSNNKKIDKSFKTSLIIFHGNSEGWYKPEKINTYIFLKTDGRFETPSFELISSHSIDKNYYKDYHKANLNAYFKGDFIILPSESGIDSYIYWNGNDYEMHDIEEIP